MKKILFLHAGNSDEAVAIGHLREAISRLAPREARCESVDLFSTLSDFSSTWRLFSSLPHPGLGQALRDLLHETEPDVVVSTAAIFNQLIAGIFNEGRTRDFKLISLLLDFVPERDWPRSLTDRFVVVHEKVAESLVAGGVDPDKIEVCGFPIALNGRASAPASAQQRRRNVLYLINGSRRKASKLIDRLLEHRDWNITVQIEKGEETIEEVARTSAATAGGRMRIADPSESISSLLALHDLVISRAETEIVHEAVSAACPLVIFRPGTGNEKNNLSFLREANAATAAEKPREVIAWIERAFQDEDRLLSLWRENLRSLQRPESSLAVAKLILQAAEAPASAPVLRALPSPVKRPTRFPNGQKKLLLCDLHTHTTWSDGKLTIPELIDFYGQRAFDCLCITDHLCDPNRLLGRLVNLTGLVLAPDKIGDYFSEIEREKKRAWDQYELLLMAGIEFNKDGYTAKSSAHLLGVDLQGPIDPTLDLKRLIVEIQAQGGLAIASHPHEVKSAWGKNTLYLWEHLDEFAPLIDVWEVANRDDIFNPVGLKKLPFMGNSDFHKPKHIHSWKTVLHCEKDREAIKDCLRVNRDVSLTLYRDHRFGLDERKIDLRSDGEIVQLSAQNDLRLAKQG